MCSCSCANPCPRGTPTRTVAILGAAYGGAHAAQMLAESLPPDWRLVVIDRQSHMNHVYVFPRFIVMPEHAPKSFVPYRNMFGLTQTAPTMTMSRLRALAPLPTPPATPPRPAPAYIQGHIIGLSARSVTFIVPDERGTYDGLADDGSNVPPERIQTVNFDYCVYALGAGLPAPCDVWGEYGRVQLPGRGSKAGGVSWMRAHNEIIKAARSVCVVGAGALGIQFSSDIKDLWPDKTVTLIHSRTRVLPRYPPEMHDVVVAGLRRVGVDVILGERVVQWPANMDVLDGVPKTVVTEKGTAVTADIVLACTGPKPHSELMRALEPNAIAPNGRIRVKPTTQVDVVHVHHAQEEKCIAEGVSRLSLECERGEECEQDHLDHFFCIGDCADTTAIMAGHTAYWQGEIAARNILRLIESEGDDADEVHLEMYAPGPPAIKVTLGIHNYVIASGDSVTPGYDAHEDLQARDMWPVFNAGAARDDE